MSERGRDRERARERAESSIRKLKLAKITRPWHALESMDEQVLCVDPERCAGCGASPACLVCSRCRSANIRTTYCAKECQVRHWKGLDGHKHVCGIPEKEVIKATSIKPPSQIGSALTANPQVLSANPPSPLPKAIPPALWALRRPQTLVGRERRCL